MTRRALLPLSILLLAGTAGASPPLTLQEAVAVALEQNPAVRSARESADAAAARAAQARGARRPRLDLVEAFTWTDQPASVFALTLNQERFDLGGFLEADPNQPDTLDTWSTHLELTLPVYTGGQLTARIDQAAAVATAEESDFWWARELTAHEVVAAFVELAKARDSVALLRTARATTLRHVELARSLAGQGMLLEADVLKAEVHLAEVEEHLARAESGAALAEASLNFRLGTDQGTPRQLAPLPAALEVDGTLEERLARALDRRRDLEAARARLEAGRLEERVARAGFLPEVAVRGSYDLFDDTPFGSRGGSATVVAFARLNLYRGGADAAALESARSSTRSFEQLLRRFEDSVRLEVRQAWQELATARARQATASRSLAAAGEAVRVTQQRFRQGLERIVDLLDAETALREAQSRELSARYDALAETFRLRHLTGDSLVDSPVEVFE